MTSRTVMEKAVRLVPLLALLLFVLYSVPGAWLYFIVIPLALVFSIVVVFILLKLGIIRDSTDVLKTLKERGGWFK
jgi:hypothetical protein